MIKQFKMNLLEEINKIVPDSVKVQIKDLQAKFNAIPVQAPVVSAPANLAAIETKLKDGKTLSIDKMEVGGKAQLISEDGVIDAPDGTYEAEDGTMIICSGGVITEIKPFVPVSEPAPANDMPAMYEALSARLTAIEAKFGTNELENKALKTELENLSSATKVTLSAVNSILSIPAGNPIEKPVTTLPKSLKNLAALGDLKQK